MSSLKFSLLILSACLSQTYCTYSGPFLLWGIDNLNGLKIPTLESIDDSVLRDIYSKSAAIVLFLRNKTNKLSNDNFPELSGIISKNEWLYLPQDILPINPLEFNENAEVSVIIYLNRIDVENTVINVFSKMIFDTFDLIKIKKIFSLLSATLTNGAAISKSPWFEFFL